MHYILYGGHGLCMGWWGVTDGRRGMMAIVETPEMRLGPRPRLNGLLCVWPALGAAEGLFGPAAADALCFFDDGGYVAMAKRYREHAQEIGLFKTSSRNGPRTRTSTG